MVWNYSTFVLALTFCYRAKKKRPIQIHLTLDRRSLPTEDWAVDIEISDSNGFPSQIKRETYRPGNKEMTNSKQSEFQ